MTEATCWTRPHCRLQAGCTLAAGHAGSCEACEEEGVYEVEAILAQRTGARGAKQYLVKWKGWPVDDSTWEASSALNGCRAILRKWKEANKPAPSGGRDAGGAAPSSLLRDGERVAKTGESVGSEKSAAQAKSKGSRGRPRKTTEVKEEAARTKCADGDKIRGRKRVRVAKEVGREAATKMKAEKGAAGAEGGRLGGEAEVEESLGTTGGECEPMGGEVSGVEAWEVPVIIIDKTSVEKGRFDAQGEQVVWCEAKVLSNAGMTGAEAEAVADHDVGGCGGEGEDLTDAHRVETEETRVVVEERRFEARDVNVAAGEEWTEDTKQGTEEAADTRAQVEEEREEASDVRVEAECAKVETTDGRVDSEGGNGEAEEEQGDAKERGGAVTESRVEAARGWEMRANAGGLRLDTDDGWSVSEVEGAVDKGDLYDGIGKERFQLRDISRALRSEDGNTGAVCVGDAPAEGLTTSRGVPEEQGMTPASCAADRQEMEPEGGEEEPPPAAASIEGEIHSSQAEAAAVLSASQNCKTEPAPSLKAFKSLEASQSSPPRAVSASRSPADITTPDDERPSSLLHSRMEPEASTALVSSWPEVILPSEVAAGARCPNVSRLMSLRDRDGDQFRQELTAMKRADSPIHGRPQSSRSSFIGADWYGSVPRRGRGGRGRGFTVASRAAAASESLAGPQGVRLTPPSTTHMELALKHMRPPAPLSLVDKRSRREDTLPLRLQYSAPSAAAPQTIEIADGEGGGDSEEEYDYSFMPLYQDESSDAEEAQSAPHSRAAARRIVAMIVAQAKANARAKRAMRQSMHRHLPLPTSLYDVETWYRPLTHASHVAYSSLPSRPPELEGKALFGWVPEGWREENWRGHLGSEATDSMLCVVCEEGHEQAGNLILLCDGCDAPYHMRCLSTPLRRVPSGNWYCPACKREAKVSRVAKAAQERAEQASDYEKQRLENIERNNQMLEKLGLFNAQKNTR